MKIENVVIYGNSDNVRVVNFNTNGVSIISGESKTGKTSLIFIVDYCLGSGKCDIAEGVIRNNSEWFAITIVINDERIFIARQNPNAISGKISADICILDNLEQGELPLKKDIHVNSNVISLRYLLESSIGIGDYVHEVKNKTRDNLKVSFKHSRLYCYQPQDLIAQKNTLFYRQNSKDGGFVSQSIRDTIPYFLGAVSENYVYLKNLLAAKNKEHRKLSRDLDSYVSISSSISSNILSIVEEAKSIGLMPINTTYDNETDLLFSLRKTIDQSGLLETETIGERNSITPLIDERRELGKQIDDIRSEISAIESFRVDTSFYIREANHQVDRLKSIGLYKSDDNDKKWNSILGVYSDYVPAQIRLINERLQKLQNELDNSIREKPRVTEFIKTKEIEIENLKEKISNLNTRISSAYKANEEYDKSRNIQLRKGEVLGKMKMIVDNTQLTKDDSFLKSRIRLLETEIEAIEDELSDDNVSDKILSSLNSINLSMSKWVNLLDTEYKNSPVRFDIRKLMVYADTPDKSIPLSDMGSAANWVSYHLLIHFALHKYFIENNSSVPNFLFIDQPTQAYYPPSELVNLGESSDDLAVKLMYDFIFDRVEEMNGHLQVILTDHALIDDQRFKSSLIETWRDNIKLIPIDWL
ncbi:DUF3732 domain-containing protein [Neolewinella agarilytica]|uniref:DUF3732 domain-containing protein n=1 Tax=Neolewinella agarilytica TaxID=478744 RepID=UPI0023566D80|nr:DUF3732 domain-containing protein [Neolewinella agarilytica]